METLKDDLSESQWPEDEYDQEAEPSPEPEPNAAACEGENEHEEEKEDPIEAKKRQAKEEAAKRIELFAKQKEKQRRNSAKVIQKAVRNWIRHKKSGGSAFDFLGAIKQFIDGEQNKIKKAVQGKKVETNEQESAARRLQQQTEKFGFDSEALRKPAVVEEYMAENNLRKLLILELANLFKEKYFPTNPFPHFYSTLRGNDTSRSERVRVSDAAIKKLLEDRADIVFQGSRDSEGCKFPVTSVEVKGHLAGEGGAATKGGGGIDEGMESVTVYGEVPTLLTTDPVMLQRLGVALGALLKPVKKTSHHAGQFTVGRALVGTCIHHFNSNPFPGALELTDECLGVGSDFEALLALYCDHVISDLIQFTHTGYHQHLGGGSGRLGDMFLGVAGTHSQSPRHGNLTMDHDCRADFWRVIVQARTETSSNLHAGV